MHTYSKLLIVGWLVIIPGICGANLLGKRTNLLTNGGFEDGLSGWQLHEKQSLVTNLSPARSGSTCLTGEVTKPNRSAMCQAQVPVKAGYRYQFSAWARASQSSKLVAFVVPPGKSQKERLKLGSWSNVSAEWHQYTSAFSVDKDGLLSLQIVAPTSYGASPGQMWIDDVRLDEIPMPALTNVSQGVGYNDEPALAQASDGSIYVAWNSFRRSPSDSIHSGHDSLQVARFQPSEPGFDQAGDWQILGGPKTYVLKPVAVAAKSDVYVLYASEVAGDWNIYAVRCGLDGPERPIAITTAASVDVKPAACWHNDTLWIAWESNRNQCRQIFAASMRDGKVSEATPLSALNISAYDPSIAVLGNGEVCIAYSSFRQNNYDIYLRRKKNDGDWQKETRLTSAPTIDRHAVLFSQGNDLWIAYENAQTYDYQIGRTTQRQLHMGKITANGVITPQGANIDSPLTQGRCEGASAGFDAKGRLWLSFLRPRPTRDSWDSLLTCFADGRWQGTQILSNGKGMDRTPVLAIGGAKIFACLQNDDTPRKWKSCKQASQAVSNVFLTSLDTKSLPHGLATQFEPIAESDQIFQPARIRLEHGEDLPTPEIQYKGETLHLYFGDLHEHSDISICSRDKDQSIDESYQYMRDIARYDFGAMTDHGYNMNAYLWAYTAKMARACEDRGRFLTFFAEEWTSTFEEYSDEHPYGYYGHRNLIFADPYFPRWWNSNNRQTPTQVESDLQKLNANFIFIPHQLADTGNVPTDWSFVDEKLQPVAEIFQVRGSYEYKGARREAYQTVPEKGYFLQDVWARGTVVGVIASPDHGGGYGKACVYAPELTRTAILDAFRARHCYGTTAAKIFLDMRVDGHLMGEKIATLPGKSVEVKVSVRCPGDIDRIEVCRNNKFIYSHQSKGRNAEFVFTDRDPLTEQCYYYVRVIQTNTEIAWSSPVWFGAP